jgi:hypothetical protein
MGQCLVMGLLTYPKVGANCATTNKIFSYQVKPQGGAMFFFKNFCLWLKWRSLIGRGKKKVFITLGKYSQKSGYKEKIK